MQRRKETGRGTRSVKQVLYSGSKNQSKTNNHQNRQAKQMGVQTNSKNTGKKMRKLELGSYKHREQGEGLNTQVG